ncbi:unnamed protein product [Rhizophagus irregularis]|nr:unnamed protein product [Rhizophagus irregularis]
MADTGIYIKVIRKETIREDSSLIKLKITNKSSEVRKILAYDDIIRMNDGLLFLDRDYNIITIFKTTFRLEYGRTLTLINTEIKIVDCIAFTINRINPVKPIETIHDGTVEFNSKDTWEKKINMFLNAEAGLVNFGSLRLMNTKNKSNETVRNFSLNYTKISKSHLKFEGLEPTNEFIEVVKKAIESQDREKLRKIIKRYGQFVPTKVTLGGMVYEGNSNIDNSIRKSTTVSEVAARRQFTRYLGGRSLFNFDDELWIESLSNYKCWKCIEFHEPIHIFQLLDHNLRKEVYKVIGKKILYRDIISFSRQLEYGEREIVDLPLQEKICEIIKKEEADCSIFATIVGDEKNDFYNCQIYHPRKGNEKPKLIIHCYQKNQKRHILKIGFMIIGYGFDFPNDENDENDENDDTRLEVHYQDYQHLNGQELTQFIFDQNTFLGIPVLNELNDLDKSFLIGHYFLNKESTIKANVFSYSLKENKYVKLPHSFRFQVLVSGNSKTYESIHFRKKMNGNSIINLIDCGYKYDDLLFISLLSNKNFGPVFFFLKQQPKQIKLKFIDKKISSDECDLRCIVFNPFRSGIFAKLQKTKDIVISLLSLYDFKINLLFSIGISVAPVIRKPEISKITTSEEKKANRDVWIKNKIKDEDINFFEYNEFSNIKTIGEGGFGVVSSAVTDDGNKVALKSFINNNEISEFFEELRLVRKINFHKNLNRFLGITKDHVGNYILRFALKKHISE